MYIYIYTVTLLSWGITLVSISHIRRGVVLVHKYYTRHENLIVTRSAAKLFNGSNSSRCDAFGLLEVDDASVILVPGDSVLAQMCVN